MNSIASVSRSGSRQEVGVHDPVGNGVGIGALAGAGIGLALTAAAFASCNDNCEGPAPGPTYTAGIALGAGAGALVGWLIDRAHKSKPRQVGAVTVSPIVSRHKQGIAVAVTF